MKSRFSRNRHPANMPKRARRLRSNEESALLSEVDGGTRELCGRLLEGLGFVVDAVDSGVAAVALARRRPPHLVLLDLGLRDVSGQEAASWLRSNPLLNSTPVIAISALARGAALLSQKGFDAAIGKPVSPEEFARVVRGLLALND